MPENPIIKTWFDSDFRVRYEAMKDIVKVYGDEKFRELVSKIQEEITKEKQGKLL